MVVKTLITTVLALLVFIGCSNEENTATTNVAGELIPKETLRGIVLTDTAGKKIKVTILKNGFTFEGYEDKVVLVNFFTTWCPPCRAKIPHLNNLQKKYKSELKIISVLLEENKSNNDVINFINYNNIEFTITNSSDNYKLADAVGGVKSIPLMFIYDRSGKYSQHHIGAVSKKTIEVDIKKVL